MPRKHFKILVVDDDPLTQQVIALQLEDLGYCCDIVGEGGQALERLSKDHYNLVLLDRHMPGLNGQQTIAKIREIEARGRRRTIVVAFTADNTPADRRECLDAGMDDYLAKPFKASELGELLSKWDRPIDVLAIKEVSRIAGAQRFKTMALSYVERARQDVSQLGVAISGGNLAAASACAHQLKGKSGTFGASRVEALAVEIEKLIKAAQVQEASSLIADLESELKSYEGSLNG